MPAALAALHHQVERFVPGGGSRTGWHELAAQRPCGGPYACGAQPGVVTVRTGRGLASVPAWRFTVAGQGWKVSEVAVARRPSRPARVRPDPARGPEYAQGQRVDCVFRRRPDPDSQLHRLGMRCGLGRLPLREQRHGGGRLVGEALRRQHAVPRPWACPAPPA